MFIFVGLFLVMLLLCACVLCASVCVWGGRVCMCVSVCLLNPLQNRLLLIEIHVLKSIMYRLNPLNNF